MDREKDANEISERRDEATDDRTLAEIEADEKLPGDVSDAPTLEPDEGSGRGPDENQDRPA